MKPKKSKTPHQLSNPQLQKRIAADIPHRIRSVLYGIPMPQPWAVPALPIKPTTNNQKLSLRCFGDAAWEGRMSAIRWLIMFVGITYDSRKKGATEYLGRQTDVRIDAFPEGRLFMETQQGADILAQMWECCSKATSHATDNTGHSSPGETHLAEALLLIIQHLEATIYAKHGTSLHHYTMKC